MDFENEVLKKNNIPAQQQQQQQQPPQPPQQQQSLTDIDIHDENTALNILVSFLNVANKRGTFTLEESWKIWECVRRFQR